jgi:pyruvate dehydrogenase E1 component alpha subunit
MSDKPYDPLSAYRLMLISRAIDDNCTTVLDSGRSVPNYHSGRGQEALVALGLVLDRQDYLQYTYRDFAPLLAKGLSVEQLVADLRLKVGGTTAGFGGIMHVTAPNLGIPGRNSVFGSRFGIAVGLALSAVAQRDRRVVMSIYGEAEGGRGPLHEAINFACLRSLPIIFVAENNGFSISARTAELFAGGDMSTMWRGMPMPVVKVDGNDVDAVGLAAAGAVDRARAGLGPSLVEVVTYRIDAHRGGLSRPLRLPLQRRDRSVAPPGSDRAAGAVAGRRRHVDARGGDGDPQRGDRARRWCVRRRRCHRRTVARGRPPLPLPP